MKNRKKQAMDKVQMRTSSKAEQRAERAASALPEMNKGSIPSDVGGSYTGTPADDIYPVQDADDL